MSNSTRAAKDPRKCQGCNKLFPKAFYEIRNNGRSIRCPPCRKQCDSLPYTDRPTRHRKLNHRKYTLKSYGLTEHDYEEIKESLGNLCEICYSSERIKGPNGEIRPLTVDHDHITGKVRGLLCHRCNVALGGFKDDLRLVFAAIIYLCKEPRNVN